MRNNLTRSSRPVAIWLLIGVFMIIIQILLGGITRLTGSGLSITEWKPIMGTLPPMNEQEWHIAFEKYKQIAQYKYLNSSFTLPDFKFIFFWEWFHRLWARLIGVVFIIPFVVFLLQKRFKPRMVRPLLILFFGICLNWYNTSGWNLPSDRVLPSITLGLYYTAYISRLTRGGMLEILNQDFIRTARAKGATEWRIVWKHALRGGLLSVVSFLGPAVAGIITGSLVVESIFQIPGLSRFFIMAGFNRDYTMVMGTVLFFATLTIFANLVVDILQVWLNPKLRFE